MGKLEGKVALVTGAASPTGIGFAIAKKFASEGVTVLLTDILPSIKNRSEDLKALGYHSEAYITDLTKKSQISKMIQAIKAKYDRIEILCNNAGKSVPPRPPFTDMSEEYFDLVMNRNMKTTFLVTKAVVPLMIAQKYGRIINLSSITGNRVVYRHCVAYAAAKGAVSALTRALALELGEFNIAVNAILPGQIDVSKNRWSPNNDTFNFKRTPANVKWPMHRPGFPEDVANLASFLASNECSWITGEEIVIDGGSTLVEPATSSEGIFSNENQQKRNETNGT